MISPSPAKGVSVFVFHILLLLLHILCYGTAAELANTLEEKGCFA